MAKVIRRSLPMYPGSNVTTADRIMNDLYAFYTSLNIPILTSIEQEGAGNGRIYVTIDNRIRYYHNMTIQSGCYIRIGLDGESTSAAGNPSGYAEFTIGYSDTLFYLQIRSNQNRRNILVYEKVGNDDLFGNDFSGSTGRAFRDISSVILTDQDTGTTYTHGKIIGYENDAFHIDYLPTDMLIQASMLSIQDSNFIPCTTVATDSVITFGAYNYYSVGANTLLKIDN